MRTLRDAGYEVVGICPRADGTEAAGFERREGIEIFRYAQPPAGDSMISYLREYAAAVLRIRRLARRLAGERGFDVVHVSNPPDFLLASLLFLRRAGTRMIFDQHDLTPELYLARFGGRRGIGYRLMVMLERTSFRLADVVLATNESYRAVALERGGKPAEQVFVVRNGPRLDTFTSVDADPALRRGRRALIAFIGEIEPQDGVDLALRALARLRERRDDWHAVFAGRGSAVGEVQQLASDLGLAEHVEWPGWLWDDELRRLLCTADVCIVPDPASAHSDISTLVKVAEYMALSRAIVAFDLRESRVTAGAAARFVPAGDIDGFAQAIGELLDDHEARERMGRIGRERVERELAWEHSQRALLAAYEAALAARPRRPSALRRSAQARLASRRAAERLG